MEPSAIQTGTVIDRYTVESMIGEGGMAVVFRVRHNTLGTLHALKVLTLSSRQIRDRLRQEGQFQAKLQHPNVVSVTDVIDLGGTDALVMEYIDGPSLEAMMHRQRLTIAQADELARGILAGVGEAHRLGYVHRDLKPGNVLLKITSSGYVPKVADFGLAKSFGGGSDPGRAQTRTGSTMGTPHYMSPEQIRDSKNVGPRSDIFSLGAIFFEMVSGRRAFVGSDLLDIFNAVANSSCPPIRTLVPDVPMRMEEAIQAAMQIDPRDRPETVESLATIWRGTNGATIAPGSAFDMAVLPVPGTPPVRGSETWAAAETLPDSAPPESAPPTTDSANLTLGAVSVPTTSRVAWVLGLGGGMAMVVATALLLGILGAGGLWWWSQTGSGPVAEVPVLRLPKVQKAQAPIPPSDAVDPPPKTAATKVAEEVVDPKLPEALPLVEELPPVEEPPSELPAEPEPPVAVVTSAQEGPPDATLVAPTAADAPGPELVGMQASDDPEERLRAILNLAKRNDDEAIVLLDHFVRNDPDPAVRREAWIVVFDRYLRRSGDVVLLKTTVVWQMGHGKPHEAVEAVEAFGRYGTDPRLLVGPIRHSSIDVRAAAATVVLKIAARADGEIDYDGLLAPLLEDEDTGVRRKANLALLELP